MDLRELARDFEKNLIRKLWNEIKGLIQPVETGIIQEQTGKGQTYPFHLIIPFVLIFLIILFFLFKRK